MGRKKKLETEVKPIEQPELDENFMKQFTQAMNTVWGNLGVFNPFWQNELLKNINTSPHKYDRDKIKDLLSNPQKNEKALRDLSQYLFNFILEFKRLTLYLAQLPSWDYMLIPTNADEEDMKSKPFKKSYKKALDWIEKLDVKSEFPKMLNGIMLEDAKFVYLRESENGIRFQELPQQYCMISGLDDLGYNMSFNLCYFLRPGVNFDDFAPEFKDYYNELIGSEAYNKNKSGFDSGSYFYWKQLDPAKARVFKFDNNHAGIVPPLAGTFLDSIEIATFKEMLKSKSQMDIYKLLVNRIPMQKDMSGKNRKDDFSVTAQTAAAFTQIMNQNLPQNIKAMSTPLEVQAIDFAQAETKNSIVGLGSQEFWSSSGTSNVLFGASVSNGLSMQASIKTDEMFVLHIYRQFEKYLNFLLRNVTGRYRFKIRFEGTYFDKTERYERASKAVQYGAPISLLATSMGLAPHEFMNLVNMEKSFGWVGQLSPVQTSHTMSNNEGGRPMISDTKLTPNAEASRDNGSNQDTLD